MKKTLLNIAIITVCMVAFFFLRNQAFDFVMNPVPDPFSVTENQTAAVTDPRLWDGEKYTEAPAYPAGWFHTVGLGKLQDIYLHGIVAGLCMAVAVFTLAQLLNMVDIGGIIKKVKGEIDG